MCIRRSRDWTVFYAIEVRVVISYRVNYQSFV